MFLFVYKNYEFSLFVSLLQLLVIFVSLPGSSQLKDRYNSLGFMKSSYLVLYVVLSFSELMHVSESFFYTWSITAITVILVSFGFILSG